MTYAWSAGEEITADKLNKSQLQYGEDAGASDTYAVTLSPAPAAYNDGQVFNLYLNTANTGAATLNINSLGAKTIKKMTSLGYVDLETGDILAGQHVLVTYDTESDTFRLLSPAATTPKVKVGVITLVGTGSLAVTGVGFKPKLVLFLAANAASSGGDQAMSVSLGAAVSASEEACANAMVADAGGQASGSEATNASIIVRGGPSASTITEQADFTTMDTDGFTINVSTYTADRNIIYVAIG